MVFDKIGILFLVTLLPFFELRASIPLGILSGRVDLPFHYYLQGFGLHWGIVFLVCVVSNIILGPAIYLLLGLVGDLFLKIPFLNRLYSWKIAKTQAKAEKYVSKFGILGLAIFVGVPLPGSGSYTGAIAAHVLGMKMKDFFIANTVGVVIAGVIVTILTIGAGSLF